MSCWTLTAIRDNYGWSLYSRKYGSIDWSDPEGVVRRLDVGDAYRVSDLGEGQFGGWECRGWLLDTIDRVFRFHWCEISAASFTRVQACERRMRSLPVWEGWDTAYAWGAQRELAEIIGIPDRLVQPREPLDLEWDRQNRPEDGVWEPARHRLTLPFDSPWADWADRAGMILVVRDGRSVGYASDLDHRMAAEFLRLGPVIVDEVERWFPRDCAWPEACLDWGVLIDVDQKRIRFFGVACTPGDVDGLRARHPDWDIARDPHGYPGILAGAGHDPEPLLDAEPWWRSIDGDRTLVEPARTWPPVRTDVRPCEVRYRSEDGTLPE